MDLEELSHRLCADLDRDEWLLWASYLIENQSQRISLPTLALLQVARELVLGGHGEFGPGLGSRTIH